MFFRGDAVYCPCCKGRFARFVHVGSPRRPAACPRCDSRERQRLLHLYLRARTTLFSKPTRVLHIAAEDCLQSALRRLRNIEYVSADLSASRAMVATDLMKMAFADECFDAVLCSHVLEHVADDGRAMRELFRIVKPGGWVLVQVPLDPARAHTFEDPTVTTPARRTVLFGQADHVRVYGTDCGARLSAAGFNVDTVRFAEQLGPETARICGLDREELVFHCSKPRSPWH